MQIISTKLAILAISLHNIDPDKNYTKIGCNKMRALLSQIYGIEVGRRQIYQHWRDLIDEGYLNRKPRYDRSATYPHGQRTSLYSFTWKGAWMLLKMGFRKALDIINRIKKSIAGDDKRWPKRELQAEQFTVQEIADNQGRLKALVETLA